MKNWKDYVGYMPRVDIVSVPGQPDRVDKCQILFMQCKEDLEAKKLNGVTSYCLSITKTLVSPEQFTFNRDNVGQEVERLLISFPEVTIKPNDYSSWTLLEKFRLWWRIIRYSHAEENYDLQQAKINIGRKTRRGVANTNFEKVWFYRGKTVVDQPIIVAEHNGKYAVVPHPNFSDYGFTTFMVNPL